jgi:hypothetical protein
VKIEKPQREETLLLSDQMKAWSTALAVELSEWPQVTLKSFFGFTALYRGKSIFGLLPRTRSIFKGNAVAFRINSANGSLQGLIEKDPRISAFDKDKARWFTFELSRDPDLHDALEYLRRAFEAACNSKKKR